MKNAGYCIISMKFVNEKDGFCIGEKLIGSGTQYVTWSFSKDDRSFSYYWGHYFSSRNEAFADYYERLHESYERYASDYRTQADYALSPMEAD